MYLYTPSTTDFVCFTERYNRSPCIPDFPVMKYYYDSSTGECVAYHSINCEAPDVNSFRTQEDCQQQCSHLRYVVTTPTPNVTTPTTDGSGETPVEPTETTPTFAVDTTTHSNWSDETTTTEASTVPMVTSSPASLTPEQESLGKFDYALIGMGTLALCLCVILALVVAMVIYKYRRRLSLTKQDVM